METEEGGREEGGGWREGGREGRPGKPMNMANPPLRGIHGYSKRSRTTAANGKTSPCRLQTKATRMGARTGARSRTVSNPASAKEFK